MQESIVQKVSPGDMLAPQRVGRRIGGSLAGLGALLALAACGAPPQAPPVVVEVPVEVQVEVPVEVAQCELPAMAGGRTFLAEAWAMPDARFNVGEPLRLQMRISAPAYVSIFHVSTSCKVTRLLDNHPVQPTAIVEFPLAGSGIGLTVKPPEGNEAFYIVATREALGFLSGSDILGEVAGIASLDLSPAQFYSRLEDVRGRINPDDWSMTTLATEVVGH